MKITELITLLSKLGTKAHIILYFDDGTVIESISNIGVYETCMFHGNANENEKCYEYYACGISVCKIISENDDEVRNGIEVGSLLEISEFNEPRRIETIEGKKIWSKSESNT